MIFTIIATTTITIIIIHLEYSSIDFDGVDFEDCPRIKRCNNGINDEEFRCGFRMDSRERERER